MKRILEVVRKVAKPKERFDRQVKEVKELVKLGQNLVVMQLP